MKKILAIALLLLVLPAVSPGSAEIGSRLDKALAPGQEGPPSQDGAWGVWVYFTDKGLAPGQEPAALQAAREGLTSRALERRRKVAAPGRSLVDLRDVPLARSYLDAVSATGARPRRASRWLNAASFDATAEQIREIGNLPFVARLELVATFSRRDDSLPAAEVQAPSARDAAEGSIGYGLSTGALEQINVPPVHELGLTGSGVIIGQLDSGFVLSHENLQHIPIVAAYDFVHDDDNVEWEPGDHEWQDRHGTQVLSTMAGFTDGVQVGPAFGASVILAMTEDTGSETQVEEDNWVAAVEWVESLGADVVNSSLGYYYWYTWEDLDGDTAVTTVAADLAVERGITVVTSAGNQRGDDQWPYLTAPADGDSVIACAAVDIDGGIAYFSSPGPTYDGRIKPDLSALGVNVPMASYYSDSGYMTANGTSFASPLIAGVATLMLERVPGLTPMEVLEALRVTASMAGTPGNDYGWGIIDAYAAVTYFGAVINHEPLTDTEDTTGPYTVSATITSRVGLQPGNLFVRYRLDGGPWNGAALAPAGGDAYTAQIPGQPGGLVEYYLEAGDTEGIVIQAPPQALSTPYSFVVGSDLEPPTLVHFGLGNQSLLNWPPVLSARAQDNLAVAQVVVDFSVNGGPPQGPTALVDLGEGLFELAFPLDVGQVADGDVISYTLTASDSAAVPNTTTSGPWEFRVLDSLGNILVIDDSVFGAAAAAAQNGGQAVRTPGTDMAQWLTEMGYAVQVVDPVAVNPPLLDACDAVVYSASRNPAPLGESLMRAYLVDFVDGGGKILLEGGSLADICMNTLGDTEFGNKVLRIQSFLGDGYGNMVPPEDLRTHPVMVRPNLLDLPIVQDQSDNPYDYNGGDGFLPMTDSKSLLVSIYDANYCRAVVHDNNTGPEAGQIIHFGVAFYYLYPDVARDLLQNGLGYLLASEAPGSGSISGTVTLDGGAGPAGVTVATSEGHAAVTGPDGQYLIAGLHGSTYTLTATRDGYGPASRTVVLAQDQALTGVDFTLYPITELNLTAAPELPIPDYNPAGVTSVITVEADGLANSINIDIDIEHASVGHLEVTLTSPAGTSVTLHDNTGATSDDIIGNWPATLLVDGPGALEDFLGEPVQGDWTLFVADTGFGAIGTFHSWGLNLLVAQDVISPAPDQAPRVTRLLGNVPNPFNPQTVVVFELAAAGPAVLEVYDIRGHRVRELVRADLEPGRHEILWDGNDSAGRSVASGVYFCRMQAAGQTQLMKMALVR